MLRSVFTVRQARLAVVFEGGHVVETGAQNSSSGEQGHGQQTSAVNYLSQQSSVDHDHERGQIVERTGFNAVDLAYSADASMLVVVTEDKHVCVWRTTTDCKAGRLEKTQQPSPPPPPEGETRTPGRRRALLGRREVPKKPTSVSFAPAAAADRGSNGDERGEVLVITDKCGDAYAAPLPDPSVALKHLLGHTAMTITAMALLRKGTLLATADRAEHIRVSQFPRTSIVHAYLLGHTDFVSALAPVPGEDSLLLSGGGDGMLGLWDAERGERLAMISVRRACQDLADGDEQPPPREDQGLYQEEGDGGGVHPPSEGVEGMDLEEGGGGRGKGEGENGTGGAGCGGEAGKGQKGGKNGELRGSGRDSERGDGAGGADRGWKEGDDLIGGDDDEQHGREGGVPLSIACSEDGRTVAVAVSGLEGLLLLTLSRGEDAEERRLSFVPRGRLQLPAVPIQAGFLDGDLIVALPSSCSDKCLRAFRLTEGRDGAVPATADTSPAQAKCAAIVSAARAHDPALHRDGGEYILKAAVPDDVASEALGGGLRKHKGTRNAGKSSNGWNNFSKRRDRKTDKKRKRTLPTRPPFAFAETSSDPLALGAEAPPSMAIS